MPRHEERVVRDVLVLEVLHPPDRCAKGTPWHLPDMEHTASSLWLVPAVRELIERQTLDDQCDSAYVYLRFSVPQVLTLLAPP